MTLMHSTALSVCKGCTGYNCSQLCTTPATPTVTVATVCPHCKTTHAGPQSFLDYFKSAKQDGVYCPDCIQELQDLADLVTIRGCN